MTLGGWRGGGLMALMAGVRELPHSYDHFRRTLDAADGFGRQVGRWYLETVRGAGSDGGWVVTDAISVIEDMKFMFMQLAGLLAAQGRGTLVAKRIMPLALRHSWREIRPLLRERVREFFARHPDAIRQLFEEKFDPLFPGFARHYNAAHGRAEDQPVVLWDLAFGTSGGDRTVGDLLMELLGPADGSEPIEPDDAFGITQVPLDRLRGSGYPPLVVSEVRVLPAYRSAGNIGVDHSIMKHARRSLARAAQAGEDAGLLAARLPDSSSGREVLSALLEVLAAPPGRRWDAAAQVLRWAAWAHQQQFPADSTALGDALGVFTGKPVFLPASAEEIAAWTAVARLRAADDPATGSGLVRATRLARQLGMPIGGEMEWLRAVGTDDRGTGARLFRLLAGTELTWAANGSVHLWSGMAPDRELADALVLTVPGLLVVHGHGAGGGLMASAGDLAAVAAQVKQLYPVRAALLLACEQQAAQWFATGSGLVTWATPDPVFVSRRGLVLIGGAAGVTADGRLRFNRFAAVGRLRRYEPSGSAPVEAADGEFPVQVLDVHRARQDEGTDWQRRADQDGVPPAYSNSQATESAVNAAGTQARPDVIRGPSRDRGVRGLAKTPRVNKHEIELLAWSPRPAADGLLLTQSYLLAETDPLAAAARHSGGHLLRLRVPPQEAVAVGQLSEGQRPAELRYAESGTFLLSAASLPRVKVIAVYDIGAGGEFTGGQYLAEPQPLEPRWLPPDQEHIPAADELTAAYHTLPEQVRDLLALSDKQLRRRVGELHQFAGPDAQLEAYLPEVFGDPRVTRLLKDIAGNLDEVDRRLHEALIAAINDLMLGASLVPVRTTDASSGLFGSGLFSSGFRRRAIETVTPDALVWALDHIARLLRGGQDPLEQDALVGSTGYRADEPAGVRLTRLALLNLPSYHRAALLESELFQGLLRGEGWLLAEARYAASGAEKQKSIPNAGNTSGAAAVNQLVRAQAPTIAALLLISERIMATDPAAQANAAAFAGIKDSVRDLVRRPGITRDQAREELEVLTAQWAAWMQRLYKDEAAQLAMARYRLMFTSQVRRIPGRPKNRHADVVLDQAGRHRLWQELIGFGGVLAMSPIRDLNNSDVYAYIQARRLADGRRVFVISDPRSGSDSYISVDNFTDNWMLEATASHQPLEVWEEVPPYPEPGQHELRLTRTEREPDGTSDAEDKEVRRRLLSFYAFSSWAVDALPALLARHGLERRRVAATGNSFFEALATEEVTAEALRAHLARCLSWPASSAGTGSGPASRPT
jgi:hypothetical protein